MKTVFWWYWYYGIFVFDNATFHAIYTENILIASKINLNLSGKEKFKNGIIPDGSI